MDSINYVHLVYDKIENNGKAESYVKSKIDTHQKCIFDMRNQISYKPKVHDFINEYIHAHQRVVIKS